MSRLDALGSAKALTNSSGTTTDTYTYDVWGNLTNHTGSTEQPYLYVGQLGYCTHHQDPKLNPFSTDPGKYVMLQLGVRYYAPKGPASCRTRHLLNQSCVTQTSRRAARPSPCWCGCRWA